MEMKKEEVIRKGPWKAEEDQVLINHVHKYGPREWSSIRSKGLLQRTGKSCRLRWVNKLRPDLKNGCKFSEDEQRVVIELQARLGNKWAKIATYLPGRTDNDVKNFWSSRQKRLARLNSASASNSKTNKASASASASKPLLLEAPKTSSSSSSKAAAQSCSPSYFDNTTQPIKMVPLPTLIVKKPPELLPPSNEPPEPRVHQPFQQPQPPELISFSPESQELLARLEDPFFFNVFEDPEPELSLGPSLMSDHPLPSCVTTGDIDDEFPADLFDQIDTLPSPSHW
ncbi:Transcription factor DUO1 [Linum perenne]